MTTHPRIVLIHATPVAMQPIQAAFARSWREVELVNLLDDSLSTDRAKEAELSPQMSERILELAVYAHKTEAAAILFTCSAFGLAIARAAKNLPIPVLKPNEAMFEAALRSGNQIGMLATFAPAVETMEAEFLEEAARVGSQAKLQTILVPGAMEALRAGDESSHNRLLAERVADLASKDVILLAHFSTSRAAPAVQQVIGSRLLLTSPDAAVAKLKKLICAGPVGEPLKRST